jgi:hypothetical protein
MELAKGILLIYNFSLNFFSSVKSSRLNEIERMQGMKKESLDFSSAYYESSSMNYAKLFSRWSLIFFSILNIIIFWIFLIYCYNLTHNINSRQALKV